MIKREAKLLITFDTTNDAIAMEEACKKNNIPGRLVPVPAFIAAGCGLAWCTEPNMYVQTKMFIVAENIAFSEFIQCTL